MAGRPRAGIYSQRLPPRALIYEPDFVETNADGLGLYAGPIFHASGTLVVMRAFDPGELLRLMEEWKVTVLLLVPSIYLMLAQFSDFDKKSAPSSRWKP